MPIFEQPLTLSTWPESCEGGLGSWLEEVTNQFKEPLCYQNVLAYLGTSLWSSSLLFELLVSMAVIDVGIGLCLCKYFSFFVHLFTFRFLDFHFRFAFSYMGSDILRGPPFFKLGIQLLDRCRVDLPFFSSQGFFALGSSVWREHC